MKNLIISIFIFLLLIPLNMAYAAKPGGFVVKVSGDVEIQRGGKTIKAKKGSVFFKKDIFITKDGASAKIGFTDGNFIEISSNSKFEIEKYIFNKGKDRKTSVLKVWVGKARAAVNQKYKGDNKFELKTPNAVAGVRGTVLEMGFAKGISKCNVLEAGPGGVKFSAMSAAGKRMGAITLMANQSSSVVHGKPPTPPIKLDKPKKKAKRKKKDKKKEEAKADEGKKDEAKADEGNKEEAKADEGNKEEGKKEEGKKEEGKKEKDKKKAKRDEGRRDEAKRDEGGRDEGKRDEGKRDEGKRDEGRRDDGPRDEAKRDEGPRDDGPRDDGGQRHDGGGTADAGGPADSGGTADGGGGSYGDKPPERDMAAQDPAYGPGPGPEGGGGMYGPEGGGMYGPEPYVDMGDMGAMDDSYYMDDPNMMMDFGPMAMDMFDDFKQPDWETPEALRLRKATLRLQIQLPSQ